ncbi:hypothetical protein X801_01991 [Opisthorchis viverrini]|uniref:C1q domain-containing protein n=1 Tax=Opisthorchis viverrini TaxID=6198 RepID=A0A1S8X5U9_OPIVI|nr:hypothetical protein X801_01991 [Opisthorchis viverrini]
MDRQKVEAYGKNDVTLSSGQLSHLAQQVHSVQTQVAFFAGLEYNIVEKPKEPNPRVIMNRVITNVGRAYDATTGEFTAPVDGIYILAVAVSAQGKSRAPDLRDLTKGKKLEKVVNCPPRFSILDNVYCMINLASGLEAF